jgi:hypothetical protein
LAWRAGLSGFNIDKNAGFVVHIPISFTALYGPGNHKLEMGLGQAISFTTRGKFFAITIPSLGYRFQNRNKRFFYRVTYTPLISYIVDFQYQNWAGISIGYNLKSKK